MGDEIEIFFDCLIFIGDDNVYLQWLLLIISQVWEEFYCLEKCFNMQFNGNCIYVFSYYLIYCIVLVFFCFNSEQIC